MEHLASRMCITFRQSGIQNICFQKSFRWFAVPAKSKGGRYGQSISLLTRAPRFFGLYGTDDAYGQSLKTSGKISIESNSIALAVGVNWGDGRLTFKGRQALFAVNSLTLVDVGIAKAGAIGEVYNLNDMSHLKGPTWQAKPDLIWRVVRAEYP